MYVNTTLFLVTTLVTVFMSFSQLVIKYVSFVYFGVNTSPLYYLFPANFVKHDYKSNILTNNLFLLLLLFFRYSPFFSKKVIILEMFGKKYLRPVQKCLKFQ